MNDCSFCGDSLHSFVDELEEGSLLFVVLCPTCYRVYPSYLFRMSQSFRVILTLGNLSNNKEVKRNYEY